ncbi:MAG: hypothetical protein K1000chlam3_01703 [Chlamydiae bacterium]|nr:hypothetical protein [Chlamydiota bacterium]
MSTLATTIYGSSLKLFQEYSLEIGAVAISSISSTVINEALKNLSSFRDYPKARTFVVVVLSVGETWAIFYQFGAKGDLDLEKCTHIAFAIGCLYQGWKICNRENTPESPPSKLKEETAIKINEVPFSQTSHEEEIHPENAIFQQLLEAILEKKDAEGLFRINGSKKNIEKLLKVLNPGKNTKKPIRKKFTFKKNKSTDTTEMIQQADIHELTGVFKAMLRGRAPLDTIKKSLMGFEELSVGALQIAFHKLESKDFALLKMLIKSLSEIEKNSEKTMMPTSNLAICIGPNLIKFSEDLKVASDETTRVNSITEFMIDNYAKIFSGSLLRQDKDLHHRKQSIGGE